MAELTTHTVAEHLETDARTLRRFLRRDVTYRNAGAGGRYAFTEKDLPTLKVRFDAWRQKNATRAKRYNRPLVDPEDYDQIIEIPRMTPSLRREIFQEEQRLMDMVRSAGLETPYYE